MNTLNYFGTNTREAGHYFWIFDATGQYMQHTDLRIKDLPFNPEDFTKVDAKPFSRYKDKGQVEFHKIEGYTIFAVAGSPIDSRPGCKSVFFIKSDLTEEQIIQKIEMTPAAFRILKNMPFKINHKSFENLYVCNP